MPLLRPPPRHNARPGETSPAPPPPSQSTIKVVIVGATKEIGRAAVSRARGMELAGAIDTQCIGQDAGEHGMEEPLEILVLNDLAMVLGSIAQILIGLLGSTDTVDWIGSVLLQQAAIQASFHYNNVEIVESRPNPSGLPSQDAVQIANNISDLGQIYNREDMDANNPLSERGQVLGEDGVRVHSMVLPRFASSTSIYTLKHDVTDVRCLMTGLILAIRKVIRLKNLIYGLEKFL
ncbi:hypothetical protein VPH35_071593 [Triticum aestivum]